MLLPTSCSMYPVCHACMFSHSQEIVATTLVTATNALAIAINIYVTHFNPFDMKFDPHFLGSNLFVINPNPHVIFHQFLSICCKFQSKC